MEEKKLKIAIAVPGRFYAFDLARELIRLGQEVILYTNYPKFAAERFGVPPSRVRSLLIHGVFSRIIHFLNRHLGFYDFEPLICRWFSRWAAKIIRQDLPDVIYVFSGAAEEVFRAPENTGILKVLVRGSSHIRTQYKLLEEEQSRTGIPLSKPSPWMIEREEREYRLSDIVVVLSRFSHSSFIGQKFPAGSLRLVPLGAELEAFRPKQEIVDQRLKRISLGQPIRVLMTGAFTLRKGAFDFLAIASGIGRRFVFSFVGSIDKNLREMVVKNRESVRFISHQQQYDLPGYYAWADIFLFTTIEDGYPVVLAQASASALPIIATPNSAAPDIIIEGKNGWILPIRSPEVFIERLRWCDSHRKELAAMIKYSYEEYLQRDFRDTAEDTIKMCSEFVAKKGES